jgi:transcriptional regulator with XRE-family HTH domain
MAQPAGGRLSEEFRRVYETAGFTQTELAEKLEINQATVSEWARGVSLPRVTALPMIERLCGVTKGTILRRAGYVDNNIDLRQAILTAPELDDEARKVLADTYDVLLRLPPGDDVPVARKPAAKPPRGQRNPTRA